MGGQENLANVDTRVGSFISFFCSVAFVFAHKDKRDPMNKQAFTFHQLFFSILTSMQGKEKI